MQQTSKWQTHLPYLQLETLLVLNACVSYAHALSPVERVLGHFLWDPGPMNVTISRQKN